MQKQITQFGASRAQTAGYQLLRQACQLYRIDGYCTGANTFLQLHDSKTTPSASAVPKKSLQVFGNDGFSYIFVGKDEVEFINGVYIALSTDETIFTADASGTKISGDVEINDEEAYPGFTKTVVGDYTTAVALLQVWNDPAGVGTTKQLQRLEITNNNAAAVVFCIIARSASTVGAKVIWSSPIAVAAAASADYKFGMDGLSPFEETGAAAIWQGCRVVAVLASNLTAGTVNLNALPAVIATTDFTIRATYKS